MGPCTWQRAEDAPRCRRSYFRTQDWTDGVVATMVKDNQDYYKRGGRSGGPRGPRKQFKDRLAREQAVLRRDQEHVLPSERPRAGRQQGVAPLSAVEETEAQLASLHEERGSVLDQLPRPVGAAGVPRSARPIPTASTESRQEKARGDGHAFAETGPFSREFREEEAPFGYGIPASEEAALGHEREPFERERGEMRHAAREQARELREERRELHGVPRLIVRGFSPVFRVLGDAARVIDRPVRGALDTLQWLGRAARKAT